VCDKVSACGPLSVVTTGQADAKAGKSNRYIARNLFGSQLLGGKGLKAGVTLKAGEVDL